MLLAIMGISLLFDAGDVAYLDYPSTDHPVFALLAG